MLQTLWSAFKLWFKSLVIVFVVFQIWVWFWVVLYGLGVPPYTSFMKSEQIRLITQLGHQQLAHKWMDYDMISNSIKRAVIASEDAGFVDHDGVEWAAIEKARMKNIKNGKIIAGGSTITQQLAKNLFLSADRSFFRKGQELLITFMLELSLPKQKILELYLNSVEWGNGVFGIEAASQHYFNKPNAQLTQQQAAKLAVILPNPKQYDKYRKSNTVSKRANVILRRMKVAEIPESEGLN